LVACPLAGGASSWLGWVTVRERKDMSEAAPTASTRPSGPLPPTPLFVCVCVYRGGLGVGQRGEAGERGAEGRYLKRFASRAQNHRGALPHAQAPFRPFKPPPGF
jgi:hypothetical protein